MSQNNIHKEHRKRLRDRYVREGAMSFETHNLLELFLFEAVPRSDTNPIAHRLLDRFGSLDGVLNADYDELIQIKGIGDRTAKFIINSARKIRDNINTDLQSKPMVSFERAANIFIWHFQSLSGEYIASAFLDSMMRISKISNYSLIENNLINCVTEILNEARMLEITRVVLAANFGDKRVCQSSCDKIIELLKDENVEVCDFIFVNGFDAVTLLPD